MFDSKQQNDSFMEPLGFDNNNFIKNVSNNDKMNDYNLINNDIYEYNKDNNNNNNNNNVNNYNYKYNNDNNMNNNNHIDNNSDNNVCDCLQAFQCEICENMHKIDDIFYSSEQCQHKKGRKCAKKKLQIQVKYGGCLND